MVGEKLEPSIFRSFTKTVFTFAKFVPKKPAKMPPTVTKVVLALATLGDKPQM